MRELICRLLRKHRWVSLAHRHDWPYRVDGETVTASVYELSECGRCGALVEIASIPLGEPIEVAPGVEIMGTFFERVEVACLEDAQAWNPE